MGRGEIAGHSIDITADIAVRVEVIKGLNIDGPLLLPNAEDLPRIVRPFSPEERKEFAELSQDLEVVPELDMLPVQFIGTGKDLNMATSHAVTRAARFMNMSEDEILNRALSVGKCRFRCLHVPRRSLESKGLWNLVSEHYKP